MNQPTQGVIFDFDGVLVDSEPMHEWAIRETVRSHGWDFQHEQFVRQIVGGGDENAFRLIAQWNGASVDAAEVRGFLERKWVFMAQGIAQAKYTVQPGAIEAVRAAGKRGPIAVCSGSVRGTVEPMLRAIGVRDALGALVCGDDVQRMKPDPEGYLLAAARLGCEATRCIAVEDTATGVRAAKAAGMRVIAVCHTVPAEMLREADEVVADIRELRLA